MSWHLCLFICSSYFAIVHYFIISFIHWLLNVLSVDIRVYVKFVTNLGGYWSPLFFQNWWWNEKSGWNQYTREEKQGDQTSSCIQIGAPGGGFWASGFYFALPLCCSCLSWNWSLLRIIRSCKSSELTQFQETVPNFTQLWMQSNWG